MPIVGNMLQFDFANIHKTMLKWKKEYGGIFTIWAPKPNVVVSDHEVKKWGNRGKNWIESLKRVFLLNSFPML